ncbi:MAG: type II toxin-antitoxin system RelE/ParE family toxin [Planctomycetota bacterium]
MSDLKFEYHSEAIIEAHEAYHWYASKSEEVADRFWLRLQSRRIAVTRNPAVWTPYLRGTRCVLLRPFPYGLVFVERADTIVGVAVAHLHRRPGYWRGRLED